MKKIATLLVFLMMTAFSFAQLKSQMPQQGNVIDAMLKPKTSNLLFGFFNPANFRMSHSYSLSYSAFAGQGLALGVYTNSMFYKISDPLSMQVDISLVHSPYNSFGKQYQNQFSGIFINRAALNWRPSENTLINFEFKNLPSYMYLTNPYYFHPFWFRYDEIGFNDWYIGR